MSVALATKGMVFKKSVAVTYDNIVTPIKIGVNYKKPKIKIVITKPEV